MDNAITVTTESGQTELYTHRVFECADEFYNRLTEKQQAHFSEHFPSMIFHIRDNLGEVSRDDVQTLDKIWECYLRVCATYSILPTLSMFAVMIGVHRTTIGDWIKAEYRVKSGHTEMARRWKRDCETFLEHRLMNKGTTDINLIFCAKCNYGWTETAPSMPRDSSGRAVLTGSELPRLSSDNVLPDLSGYLGNN